MRGWAIAAGAGVLTVLSIAVMAQLAEVRRVVERPAGGTFYSLQKTNDAPLPFNPWPDLPLYAFGEGLFVFDDRAVDYVALQRQWEAERLLWRAARASLLAEGYTLETLDSGGPPPPPGGGGGGGGDTNDPPAFDPPVWLTSTQLCVLPPVFSSSNVVILNWTNGLAGAPYDLFLTTNLTPATTFLNLTNWAWLMRSVGGQTNFWLTDSPTPEGYFTLGTTNDADGDGLTDAFEALVSHTPVGTWSSPDTDGDELPDGWEVAQGLNPSRADASTDPDGDGLTNWQEWLAGSDPKAAAVWAVWVASPGAGSVIP
jgi:hypothetical protein